MAASLYPGVGGASSAPRFRWTTGTSGGPFPGLERPVYLQDAAYAGYIADLSDPTRGGTITADPYALDPTNAANMYEAAYKSLAQYNALPNVQTPEQRFPQYYSPDLVARRQAYYGDPGASNTFLGLPVEFWVGATALAGGAAFFAEGAGAITAEAGAAGEIGESVSGVYTAEAGYTAIPAVEVGESVSGVYSAPAGAAGEVGESVSGIYTATPAELGKAASLPSLADVQKGYSIARQVLGGPKGSPTANPTLTRQTSSLPQQNLAPFGILGQVYGEPSSGSWYGDTTSGDETAPNLFSPMMLILGLILLTGAVMFFRR